MHGVLNRTNWCCTKNCTKLFL